MPEALRTQSLHRKLAEVMGEAERIPKNGTYSGQGGFKYVLVGDAADAIRRALAKRHISMLPSNIEVMGESEHETRSGGTMTTLTVRTTWTLVDGDSGETATIQSLGTGADAGDKYSPKAQTNAMKYALLMGFLLSTGDDPEQSDTSDRQARKDTGARAPLSDEAATLRPEGRESEAFLGILTKSGVIRKGGADGYQLERRETPDGPTFGFRLELDTPDESGGHKAIPQVLVPPKVAVPLLLTLEGNDPATLEKASVRLKGQLYQVSQPGRRSFYRLLVSEWKDDERSIPPEEPALPEPPEDLPLPFETPA